MLHINQEFKEVFQELPFIALRKNRNLYDLLGCKNIVERKLQRLCKKKNIGFSIISQNHKTYAISKFYTCNILKPVWHKKYTIFSMTLTQRVNYWYTLWNIGCAISNKLENQKQSLANIRLNNHHKDINRQNAPQASQHFKLPYHNFNQHAKFTLIEHRQCKNR